MKATNPICQLSMSMPVLIFSCPFHVSNSHCLVEIMPVNMLGMLLGIHTGCGSLYFSVALLFVIVGGRVVLLSMSMLFLQWLFLMSLYFFVAVPVAVIFVVAAVALRLRYAVVLFLQDWLFLENCPSHCVEVFSPNGDHHLAGLVRRFPMSMSHCTGYAAHYSA